MGLAFGLTAVSMLGMWYGRLGPLMIVLAALALVCALLIPEAEEYGTRATVNTIVLGWVGFFGLYRLTHSTHLGEKMLMGGLLLLLAFGMSLVTDSAFIQEQSASYKKDHPTRP